LYNRSSFVFLFLAMLGSAWLSQVWGQGSVSIRGKVTGKGEPLEGAYVAAHATGKTYTTYVMTDSSGQFSFRGLVPGSYVVFTRIPGYRSVRKDGITVQARREAVADFQVELETDFLELVEQATNSELTESFPLSEAQKNTLDYRCGDCHGAYYLAKTRFKLKDWATILKWRQASAGEPLRSARLAGKSPGSSRRRVPRLPGCTPAVFATGESPGHDEVENLP